MRAPAGRLDWLYAAGRAGGQPCWYSGKFVAALSLGIVLYCRRVKAVFMPSFTRSSAASQFSNMALLCEEKLIWTRILTPFPIPLGAAINMAGAAVIRFLTRLAAVRR